MPKKVFNTKKFLEKTKKWVLGLIQPGLRRAPPWPFTPRNKYIKHASQPLRRGLLPRPLASAPLPMLPNIQKRWFALGAEHSGAPPSGQITMISLPPGVTLRWQAGPDASQAAINGWIKPLQGFFPSRMCTGNKFRKSCFLLQEMNPPLTGRNYSGSSKVKGKPVSMHFPDTDLA